MKIYVEVMTPGNGKIYEFQIDSTMTVVQVKERMIEEITESEKGNITLFPDKVILSNLSSQARLNNTDTIVAAGVRSGHSLMLV